MGSRQSHVKKSVVISHPVGSQPFVSSPTLSDATSELRPYRKRVDAAVGKYKSPSEVKKLCRALDRCANVRNKYVTQVGDKSSAGSVWSSGVGYGNGSSNAASLQAKKYFKQMETYREETIAAGLVTLTKAVSRKRGEVLETICEATKGTSLHGYIAARLDNDSMMDIAAHASFYIACWGYLAALLENDDLMHLVLRNSELKHRMRAWFALADQYRTTMATIGLKTEKSAQHEQLVDTVLALKPALSRSRSAGSKRARSEPRVRTSKRRQKEKSSEHDDVVMEEEAGSSSGCEEPAAKERKTSASAKSFKQIRRKASAKSSRKKKKEDPEPPVDPVTAAYVEQMTPLTFGTYSSGSNVGAVSFMGRAMAELQSLAGALPSLVHPDTSVFLRSNEMNITEMQAMIVGPKGTPYQNACFTFTITLPRSYPAQPPHCIITNTGGGRFRFNPNLYNTGKVCLSLLGTWAGTPEEMWNEDSSIYQVLVSIQSLILVEEPYYNEPSYQYKKNDAASNQYNCNVRLGAVKHGMIDLLKDKQSPFADAIEAHFRLKKEEVREQVTAWNIPQETATELFDLLDAL